VFGGVKRAPHAMAQQLREVAGVADVQTTLEEFVRVEIPGLSDPIVGQLIGLDRRNAARMNRVTVSRGRMLVGVAARDRETQGINSTGTLQRANTPVATEPRTRLPSAEWPWVPITIRSGLSASACAAMASAGWP